MSRTRVGKIPMLKAVPISSRLSVGIRRLREGLYRILLEDRTNRQAAYFEMGTLKEGKFTAGTSPEGQTAAKNPKFPAALQELKEFATVDSVMSE
jgi:hypothetical protein